MINKDEVMDLLIKASPSYKQRSENYMQENYEEGEERNIYLEISDFVDHFIDLFRSGNLIECISILEAVEKLHVNGDEFVKELATIGFLEDLQNQLGNYQIYKKPIEILLWPETRIWWDHLNNFWDGKTKYVGEPLNE